MRASKGIPEFFTDSEALESAENGNIHVLQLLKGFPFGISVNSVFSLLALWKTKHNHVATLCTAIASFSFMVLL